MLKGVCRTTGTTMHRVIRVLVGAWLIEKGMEYRLPAPISATLRRAVEIEAERETGSVLPQCWRSRLTIR